MTTINNQTFNPLKYSPTIFTDPGYTNNANSTNNVEYEDTPFNHKETSFDEIVTKGGKKVFKVDIGHFDNLCQKFRSKCDVPIKNLTGSDKEDFKLMVSYVRLLYGTNYYENLHNRVVKYFGNLDRVRPGTVGGYFGGCLVPTSFQTQPGCSAVCAGSVPRPKDDEGWSFCDKSVIFADKTTGGYKFTVLKEFEEDDESCYLFVEHTTLHDFEGFSRKEKEELRRLGANEVYLIGCNGNGTEYVHLYEDCINVNDIKHRALIQNKSDSKLGLGLILFIVFLILVVLFFGWRMWDKNYAIAN